MKTVDERFEELGLVKTNEDEHRVDYVREEERSKFFHEVSILMRGSDEPWIFSNQIEENSDGFKNAVALSASEIELCLEKIKEKQKNG